MLKILVVEDLDDGRLVDSLIGLGFAPVARDKMHQALMKLERGNFSFIVLDRDYKAVDPLEFVLNIREKDKSIPVIIVGNSEDKPYNDLLRNQRNVHTLTELEDLSDGELMSMLRH